MDDLEHIVTLEALSDGAAVVLVNRELQKVWDNIADTNTVAKAKRVVTLTLTFKPAIERKKADVDIDVKATLAQDRGADTTIWFGKKDGKNTAAEQNFNQGGLFDRENENKLRMVPMIGKKGEGE